MQALLRGICTQPLGLHMQTPRKLCTTPCKAFFRGVCTQPPYKVLLQGICMQPICKPLFRGAFQATPQGLNTIPMRAHFQRHLHTTPWGLCAPPMQGPFQRDLHVSPFSEGFAPDPLVVAHIPDAAPMQPFFCHS